jgi:hypothetical protein
MVATKPKQIMLAAGVRRPAADIFSGTARAAERALTEMLFAQTRDKVSAAAAVASGP